MVLDDITTPNPEPDFSADFSSEPPPSDSDINPKEYSYSLDLTTLPRANALIALFGRGEAGLRRSIAENVSNASKVLHRRPTQEEFNAMAYHTAKGQAILCWGFPTGITAAAYMCWQTRKEYKFPLVKPSKGFNGNEVAFLGRQWLKGRQANIFWHSLRFSAYGTMIGWVGRLFVAGYAASVVSVGELTDPRLKDLQDAIRKIARVKLDRSSGAVVWRDSETGKEVSPEEISAVTKAMTGIADGMSTKQDVDFASSQDSEDKLYGNSYKDFDDIEPTDSTPLQSSPRPHRSPTWSRAKGENSGTELDSSSGFYDTYGDASPTASVDTLPRTDTNASSGGSAWERLRKQATTATSDRSNARPGRQRPAPRPQTEENGERSSYSSSEEGKQLARDEAQRDFDAQVERERQGDSFRGKGSEW